MLEQARGLKMLISRNRTQLAVIIGWAVGIALIIIKSYQVFYWENVKLSTYGLAYVHYEGPTFTGLDFLLLIGLSILVGLFLLDVKSLIIGYFATMVLSSAIAVGYVFWYIWNVLGLGRVLSTVPYGWEDAFFLAFINVFRFMFPMGITLCFLGVAIGVFVRGWLY